MATRCETQATGSANRVATEGHPYNKDDLIHESRFDHTQEEQAATVIFVEANAVC